MNIVLALLIFSLLVIIHELGHFLLARLNGVEVTEFSIGMGPRLVTLVKTDNGLKIQFFASTMFCENFGPWKGKTKYSIKLLPFGGSCIMLGEDDVVDEDRAFCKKSVYQRMSIVFAGPFFNFVLAFILAIVMNVVSGYDRPIVTSVESGMPMEAAGVRPGDEIVKINDTKIVLDREIGSYFIFNPIREGDKYEITYKRDGEKYTVNVEPKLAETLYVSDGFMHGIIEPETKKATSYRLGFGYGSPRQKGTTLQTLKYSLYEVKYWIDTTIKSIGMIFTGKISKDDISGPVGIVSTVGDVVQKSSVFGLSSVILSLISFAILLSANLGVMNLLPIPALDGGRLFFQIVEIIRGKPISPEKEGIITMIGFVLLMLLMVFIMFNDIQKLIFK